MDRLPRLLQQRHPDGQWVDASEAAEFTPCTIVEYGSPHEEFWVMDLENLGSFLRASAHLQRRSA